MQLNAEVYSKSRESPANERVTDLVPILDKGWVQAQ